MLGGKFLGIVPVSHSLNLECIAKEVNGLPLRQQVLDILGMVTLMETVSMLESLVHQNQQTQVP